MTPPKLLFPTVIDGCAECPLGIPVPGAYQMFTCIAHHIVWTPQSELTPYPTVCHLKRAEGED